jgi:hypothetical protein
MSYTIQLMNKNRQGDPVEHFSYEQAGKEKWNGAAMNGANENQIHDVVLVVDTVRDDVLCYSKRWCTVNQQDHHTDCRSFLYMHFLQPSSYSIIPSILLTVVSTVAVTDTQTYQIYTLY